VQAPRQETILGCLPKKRRSRTVLGTFCWPEGMTPDDRTGYRRTPADGDKRRVTEIAPQEIGNAVLDVLRSDGPSPAGDVMQALNDVFGFNRTGREIRERYQQVLDLMERDGRLVRRDEVLALPVAQPATAGSSAQLRSAWSFSTCAVAGRTWEDEGPSSTTSSTRRSAPDR
jgi:hypothetical protein